MVGWGEGQRRGVAPARDHRPKSDVWSAGREGREMGRKKPAKGGQEPEEREREREREREKSKNGGARGKGETARRL
jgi:hypothetical protein